LFQKKKKELRHWPTLKTVHIADPRFKATIYCRFGLMISKPTQLEISDKTQLLYLKRSFLDHHFSHVGNIYNFVLKQAF
jgi:hypothetical protein